MESILLAHLGIVVEGTKHNLVALRELLYLVESPQLVAFLKRKRNAGQEDKDFHFPWVLAYKNKENVEKLTLFS
jgi:hypothetical protein